MSDGLNDMQRICAARDAERDEAQAKAIKEAAFSGALAAMWLVGDQRIVAMQASPMEIDFLQLAETAQQIAEVTLAVSGEIDAADVPHIDVIEMLVDRAVVQLTGGTLPMTTQLEAITAFLARTRT